MHTEDIADRLEWPKRSKTSHTCLISGVNLANSCVDLTPFEKWSGPKKVSHFQDLDGVPKYIF